MQSWSGPITLTGNAELRAVGGPLGGTTESSLQTAGSAVHVASETVLDKAKKLAAHLLEASESDIVKSDDGGLQVAGVPTSKLSWGELAQAANDAAKRPADMEAGIRAT